MAELTVLVSVKPEENRFRFFVIELRALPDGSAELHRRWGRIGTEGRHASEAFSTLALARAARAALLERRLRRGYVRASRRTANGSLDPLATTEAQLAHALELSRRELAARRDALRPREDGGQLTLPL